MCVLYFVNNEHNSADCRMMQCWHSAKGYGNNVLRNTIHSLPFVSPVSRWSLHTWHPDNEGVPRRRGDIRTEPSSHVQPHLPSGEETSGGPDQCRLQIHICGRGPGHGCRRQLPSALPGHRYECRSCLIATATTQQLGSVVEEVFRFITKCIKVAIQRKKKYSPAKLQEY